VDVKKIKLLRIATHAAARLMDIYLFAFIKKMIGQNYFTGYRNTMTNLTRAADGGQYLKSVLF
jgi:hypothetical protein